MELRPSDKSTVRTESHSTAMPWYAAESRRPELRTPLSPTPLVLSPEDGENNPGSTHNHTTFNEAFDPRR